MGEIREASQSRRWPTHIVLGFVCTVFAWSLRFVQDDAFISMRYAQNLVHGWGLTWNPGGARVEGYTNFLWTILLAIPEWLRIDSVQFTQALGLGCFALTLSATYRLANRLLGSRSDAFVVLLLLGTNFTFLAYATGGLETQLQTLLIVAVMLLALPAINDRHVPAATCALVSLLASLAFLTRMDSALLILCPIVALGWRVLRSDANRARRLLLLLGPGGLIVATWLAWRIGYYGDLLPNTFYAKVGGIRLMRHGTLYLYTFVMSYGLLPIGLLTGLVAFRQRRRAPAWVAWVIASLALWSIYMVRVGGDFMEFRFFVPALPLFFLLIVWAMGQIVSQPIVRQALIASVLAGSLAHAMTYRGMNDIESIGQLKSHVASDGNRWSLAGITLGKVFSPADHVLIATSAAGAIPYFSRLETLDMLGLSDRWIARHGMPIGNRPGHLRQSTFAYLLERRVNLVIGQPKIESASAPFERHGPVEDVMQFRIPDASLDQIPRTARVMDIPLDAESKLRVLYLVPSPAIERAIARHSLQTYPIFGP